MSGVYWRELRESRMVISCISEAELGLQRRKNQDATKSYLSTIKERKTEDSERRAATLVVLMGEGRKGPPRLLPLPRRGASPPIRLSREDRRRPWVSATNTTAPRSGKATGSVKESDGYITMYGYDTPASGAPVSKKKLGREEMRKSICRLTEYVEPRTRMLSTYM